MNKSFRLIGLVVGVVLFAVLIFVGLGGAGDIKIEAPGYEVDLTLHGRWGSKTICTTPGSETVKIRAGTYKPERLVLRLTEEGDRWWSILCRRGPWGDLATIKVARSNTTVLRIGPPLVIRADVQNNNPIVSVGLSLVGRAGEHYSAQVLTHGGNLPAPKLKIVDETGKVLAAGTFEYGWGGVCRYSWRVPEGFKGRYRVQVDMDLGPFEAEQEETWHVIWERLPSHEYRRVKR